MFTIYTRVGRALPYPTEWKATKKCHNFYIKHVNKSCSNSIPGSIVNFILQHNVNNLTFSFGRRIVVH
jgi:hypothetical protein